MNRTVRRARFRSSLVLGATPLLLALGSSAQAVSSSAMENIAAVSTAAPACGFVVNQTMFAVTLSSLGVSVGDISRGGRYRSQFDEETARIRALTSTPDGRASYCSTIARELSTLFDDTSSMQERADVSLPADLSVSDGATVSQEPEAVTRSTVLAVQKLLQDLGFDAGPADGMVGPQTRRAVEAFQSSVPGLEVDGGVDTALQETLRRRILGIRGPAEPSLRVVVEFQVNLFLLGLYDGVHDGNMTVELEKAIERYQSENNIPVDGVASAELLEQVKEDVF